MSLATLERPVWARRLAPSHALWLGPQGLWDFGVMPGWRPWAGVPRAQAAGPQHHADFDAWCQAHPGRGCSLILSAWLLHELLLDTQLPLKDDTARLAHARGLLLHHHGERALHWPLTAWQAAGRHGVSALHATTLQALQTAARRADVALRTVRPWWSLALALALQQMPRLARADAARVLVVDGALVTQIDLAAGRLTGLHQRRLARATLAALPVPADRSLCAALGHGLLAGEGADAAPEGITLLGALHQRAPAALWCGPEAVVHA